MSTSLESIFDNSWTKYEGNPVLANGVGWDAVGPSAPCVLRWDEETYRMYYMAWDEKGYVRIGYATAPIWEDSARPSPWKRFERNPVFDAGPMEWESKWSAFPEMVKIDDDAYHLYYMGGTGPFGRASLATSRDGAETWERYPENPIIPAGPPGSWDEYATGSVAVLHNAAGKGIWEMWYTGIKQPGLGGIGYATSSDGKRWTKHERNPVIFPDPSIPYRSTLCSKPHVLFFDGKYNMWFSTVAVPTRYYVAKYRISYAFSNDGIHWVLPDTNPVLWPTGSWENAQVEYPEVEVTEDGDYRMWYCGDNFRNIGYAYCKKDV